MKTFIIDGHSINLNNFHEMVFSQNARFELAPSAKIDMEKSRSYIEGRIKNGEVMYGVNTGFGAFSSVRISDAEIEQLQRNLIRSHSMGIGEPFSKIQSKGMMILRANTLARGHSGVRVEVVEKILEFLNNDLIPVIPSQGSVGASGDLAPLSHLALALIGEGEIWGENHQPQAARDALKLVHPLELKAKEGLSLINGCQVMTAIGLLALYEAQQLVKVADIAGAMSLEGLRGSRRPFDPLIAATRPHGGEAPTARNLMRVMGETSEIAESHAENDPRVQDAYSLRCMPAVHGAVKLSLRYAIQVLETEANSSTDNPLVFAEAGKILSCGNFHGMPVAHAMDFAGIAVSSLASISHERISKFISTQMSELPPFLAPQGGLNSGHMIVQVASASLVSENKVLAHPASVDSMPTSAEKEDHVSMGTIAARKFSSIVKNAQNVFAMEFLCNSQALDMIAPLKPSAGVAIAFESIRQQVPFAQEDRIFATDVKKICELIRTGVLVNAVESRVGSLEI